MEGTRAEKSVIMAKSISYGIVGCCVVMSILLGCTSRTSSVNREPDDLIADSLYTDSILEAEDTFAIDELTEETPLPVTVDELFDDFIFNFDQSNRLQRSRIRFPLTIVESDGSRTSISRGEWHHRYVFLQQEVCTAFWNTTSQMALPQDTSIVNARLEHIFLHSRQVEAYLFNRDTISGEWYLSEEQITSFEHSPLASFLDFYQRFATDSIFQRQHLAQTLKFRTTDEESDYEVIEGTIDAEQWTEFAPELPQDVLVCINYGQTYTNPNRVLMQMRGISNGLQNMLRFQCDDGRWRLTEFEN